jgi:hypothetical protein
VYGTQGNKKLFQYLLADHARVLLFRSRDIILSGVTLLPGTGGSMSESQNRFHQSSK